MGGPPLKHGIFTMRVRYELVPITLVYYTDPAYLGHLMYYAGFMPTGYDPDDFKYARRTETKLNERYTCIYKENYST